MSEPLADLMAASMQDQKRYDSTHMGADHGSWTGRMLLMQACD